MKLTKLFNSGTGKWMRKAARPSGGVDSLNSRRWRGKRLHHHGGGVCWLFVLLWMDSWCHKLIVCKIWYKNILKMRLTALLFDPPTHAPYHLALFGTKAVIYEDTCRALRNNLYGQWRKYICIMWIHRLYEFTFYMKSCQWIHIRWIHLESI